MKKIAEYFIEPSQAAESGCQRNFRHGHSRFVNELLGKKHASGLRNRDGGSAKMLREQPPKLAAAYAKAVGQSFYAIVVAIKGAIGNESERAGNRV